jgi:hypothetical protein
MTDITLEHIDPKVHPLISGLCNDFNEVLADASYNYAKRNLFVPYRVKDYPPPTNPGDLCEFLIRGYWTVTEFFGDWWLMEARRLTPRRAKDWEVYIRAQEQQWSCHIIVCSPDGRLSQKHLAMKHCSHETSKPKPLHFLTKPRVYCCRTHQNRTQNDKRKQK